MDKQSDTEIMEEVEAKVEIEETNKEAVHGNKENSQEEKQKTKSSKFR